MSDWELFTVNPVETSRYWWSWERSREARLL